jgi:hypothetical protein
LPSGRNLETIKTKKIILKKKQTKRIKEQTTTKEAPIGVL